MPGRRDVCGHRFGTSFEARRWLSLDACGCLGISVSWSVHLYALAVLAWKCISHSFPAQLIYGAIYVPVALLALASLVRASTTDPGAVPLGARPFTTVRRCSSSGEISRSNSHRQRSIRRCHKCHDNYKPARAHHDSVTGRCIVKFDHFCPWVNNSIGALNHKFFCLFLLYTALSCIVSLLLLVMRMVHCGYYTDDNDNDGEHFLRGAHSSSSHDDSSMTTALAAAAAANDNTTGDRILLSQQQHHYLYEECKDLYSNHWITVLAVCSLVYLIFSSAMGCEQLEAIETGKGKIARMKQSSTAGGPGGGTAEFNTVTTEFNEMFGGDSPHPAWHWYLPVAIPFPRGMKQVVLGYEYNAETCRPGVAYQEQTVDEQQHQEEDSLLHYAEAGQASPPSSPESDKGIAAAAADPNSANNSTATAGVAAAAVASSTATATDVRRSLYTGRPVDPLPLSRRSNSRSRSSSTTNNNSSNGDDDGDGGGITLVDRTKARLA